MSTEDTPNISTQLLEKLKEKAGYSRNMDQIDELIRILAEAIARMRSAGADSPAIARILELAVHELTDEELE